MNNKGDMVNHPSHYKTKKGFEAIDVIEAFTDGLHGIEATDTGNILKYACRWKKKNGVEDLKKIRWYVNHLIDYIESLQPKEVITVGKNHFECPMCGGNIINEKLIGGHPIYDYSMSGGTEPMCNSCGEKYIIRVNDDLSYDIINK